MVAQLVPLPCHTPPMFRHSSTVAMAQAPWGRQQAWNWARAGATAAKRPDAAARRRAAPAGERRAERVVVFGLRFTGISLGGALWVDSGGSLAASDLTCEDGRRGG